MEHFGYLALSVLFGVALIMLLRSYKDYKSVSTGRALVDGGMFLAAIFVMLVLGTYMSVSAQALVAGSSVIRFLLGFLLGVSLVLIIAGKARGRMKISKPVVKKDEAQPVD